MSLLTEFREFAARGNVVDLAVGVIIGASFGKIVTSLVDQVVMPPIGLLLGKVDFSKMEWVLVPDSVWTSKVLSSVLTWRHLFMTLHFQKANASILT